MIGLIFKEIKQDLFEMDKKYVLAHCVSRDCKLGAGIAKTFDMKYPNIKHYLLDIERDRRLIGCALPYRAPEGHLIFNLVTKEKYWEKPTYKSLESSLRDLKNGMIFYRETKLAMPLIGCDLIS